MKQAWTARPFTYLAATLGLASMLAGVGCSSDPEPVAEVPPPSYTAEPEPLAPVSISQSTPVEPEPISPAPATNQSYEPEPIASGGGFEPSPSGQTYVIRKGDTLWSIAERTYGSGKKWRDIAALNPTIDPRKLAVGQQILLP